MGTEAKTLMATVRWGNERICEVDAWNRLKALPEDYPLNTDQAAILMGFSRATLERMRKDGTGPSYFQAGARVAAKADEDFTARAVRATNLPVRYFRKDIEAWFDANKVSSIHESAIKNGIRFASIADLAEERAFFVDANGAIEAAVEEMTLAEVILRIQNDVEIRWLPATEAAASRWSSLASHKAFAQKVQPALQRMLEAIPAGIEGTEIAEITPQAPVDVARGTP